VSKRSTSVWVVIALAVAAGCSSGPASGQGLEHLPAAPYGDLQTLVRDLYIPGADSQGYVAPSKHDLSAMSGLIAMIEARELDAATPAAATLGYDLFRLADPAAPDLAVLVERAAGLKAGGTFVFDLSVPKALVIEVAHPNADAGTLDEGVKVFLQAHAGALLIAGSHRCADTPSTPCTGAEATNACAGRLRISDAAHFTGSYFQVAHERLFHLLAGSVAVSLHAHADAAGEPDVIVSEGTRQSLGADALGNRLRDGVRAAGYVAASCNAAADPTPRLCGEANVQGRSSNGSTDACLQDASQTAHRFLHVEQSATALSAPATLVSALSSSL
jgi:hypothetical protein